jgi:hypothetical protein
VPPLTHSATPLPTTSCDKKPPTNESPATPHTITKYLEHVDALLGCRGIKFILFTIVIISEQAKKLCDASPHLLHWCPPASPLEPITLEKLLSDANCKNVNTHSWSIANA